MNTVQASVKGTTPGEAPGRAARRVALLGNPNTGKTTLFNRLCNLRHKTSNFPGTTQEARRGVVRGVGTPVELVDLPGIYSLEIDQGESALCRSVLAGTLAPPGHPAAAPDSVVVVIDATNLARNLVLVGEVLRRRLPTVVAVNMIDLARRGGIEVDIASLGEALGCRVVACSARGGEGLDALREAMQHPSLPNVTPPGTVEGLEQWAESLFRKTTRASAQHAARAQKWRDMTDRVDRAFTHPVLGLVVFGVVMLGLFDAIFSLAQLPMHLIDTAFGALADWVRAVVPDGVIQDLLAGGVVNGLSGTLVFLPQICLLFFLISLLEDTGYLARAALVVNRYLAPFGLSGHAFVPLLSSHACALPGIMACRGIPDPRERLTAILVAPFMSCSARIPVYVLLTVALFPGKPWAQALAFAGCYAVGLAAGLLSALLFRRTLLKGRHRPMAMELPSYKLPSLRTAAQGTLDRAWVFLRSAGTNILAICVVLWWLGAYPRVTPPPEVQTIRAQAQAANVPEQREALTRQADALEHRDARARSFVGMLGRTVQPVFEPLGFDWRLSVGVISSFAAREVFVSTMAVVVTGQDDDSSTVMEAVTRATRDDGRTPIFTTSTSWSLLVYYVLAMQCLPTLAVTAKEAGGKRWALLQLGWMTGLAYGLAFVVRFSLRAAGVP